MSIEVETLSRLPLVSMISTLSSKAGVSSAVDATGVGSDEICSCVNAGDGKPNSPSRYSFRHRVSREREIPYRRAVAEPWRWPRKLSSTYAPDTGKTIYDPLHYIPILARKPGALRNGAPFKEWDLPPALRLVRHKLERQPSGDRQPAPNARVAPPT